MRLASMHIRKLGLFRLHDVPAGGGRSRTLRRKIRDVIVTFSLHVEVLTVNVLPH